MTNTPSPSPTGLRLRSLVNIGCLVATATWAIAVLSLFARQSGGHPVPAILIAVLGVPLLFVFVLPALIYNQWGGPSGPKVGAVLLLAGLVAAAALVMWPSVAPMFW